MQDAGLETTVKITGYGRIFRLGRRRGGRSGGGRREGVFGIGLCWGKG